jgi:elongation factor P
MKILSFAISLLLATGASAFAPAPAFTRTSLALGVAVDTSEIKNGMTLELDGEPYKVMSFSIMKQARGAAKTTIKFKNLMKGTTIENTYRSGEKFETALIEKAAHQFTYAEGVSSLAAGNLKEATSKHQELYLILF